MGRQESFDADKIEAENRSELAKQFIDALDAPESTDEETVTRVREMTEYFMTVLRTVPRDKAEGVGLSARKALAAEVNEVLKTGSTPEEKVSDARRVIEKFILMPIAS